MIINNTKIEFVRWSKTLHSHVLESVIVNKQINIKTAMLNQQNKKGFEVKFYNQLMK